MNRIAAFLLLLATLATTAAATTAVAGTIVGDAVPSPKLGRAMDYQIYLPDQFDPAVEHLPVVYLLHGAADNAQTWTRLGRIQKTLDHLIETKQIPRVLVVMPGCWKCWWVDGAKDNAESALWENFIPTIEQRYQTRADRGGRFFAGLSAGGYAVIRYALKYPHQISAAAALSPAIYRGAPPIFSAARSNPPFLNKEGVFNVDAWRKHNYPSYLSQYVAQPARVSLYLMSGRQDHFGIAKEVSQFYRQIHQHQPADVALRLVDGGHTWRVWSTAISGALIYMLNSERSADEIR